MEQDGSFELDTALLGLKFELVEALQEAGFAWFSDFSEIEADLGNAELKVSISVSKEAIKPAIEAFGKKNGFVRVFFSEEKGAFYLRRR